MFVSLPACVCEELFLSVYTVTGSVTNRELICCSITQCWTPVKQQSRLVSLQVIKRRQWRKKKKGKTAVTLRDSLDVNKEALAKVCKCHDVQSVFLFLSFTPCTWVLCIISTVISKSQCIISCWSSKWSCQEFTVLSGALRTPDNTVVRFLMINRRRYF